MIAVLNEVQILDQQIVPSRPIAEQLANFLERSGVELAPFGESSRAFARANMPCWPIWPAALRVTLLQASVPSIETRPASTCPAMREKSVKRGGLVIQRVTTIGKSARGAPKWSEIRLAAVRR